VRRLHFETLRPLCPRCLRDAAVEAPLGLERVLVEAGDCVIEGVLACPREDCLSEYPIIDGVPYLVADLRQFVAQNAASLLGRDDLSATMESLLGDCCGPGSAFDAQRQYLSTYAHDHYEDLAPAPRDESAPCGSVLALLEAGREALGAPLPGPVLDVGCAVGRSSFALAEQSGALTLGIDLSVDMLRMAQRVLHQGMVRYPRRRVGLVYERREYPAVLQGAELVDFWAADACLLPLPRARFGSAVSLNVLDCVASPVDHLQALARVLADDAPALVSTPYDWSAAATPVESWLGGHSQRGRFAGAGDAVLRAILGEPEHPAAIEALRLEAERAQVPWSVRLHERSVMSYQVHLALLRRGARVGDAG